jgi:hypothetical protein
VSAHGSAPALPASRIGPPFICGPCRMVIRRVELGNDGRRLITFVEGDLIYVITDDGRVVAGRKAHDEVRCAQLEAAGR